MKEKKQLYQFWFPEEYGALSFTILAQTKTKANAKALVHISSLMKQRKIKAKKLEHL